MTERSSDPFHIVLVRLLAERDLTVHGLAKKCEERGWGSTTGLNKVSRGEFTPGLEGMEVIAQVLGVPAATFAEYRLAVARDGLDPRAVGLKRALRNLGE